MDAFLDDYMKKHFTFITMRNLEYVPQTISFPVLTLCVCVGFVLINIWIFGIRLNELKAEIAAMGLTEAQAKVLYDKYDRKAEEETKQRRTKVSMRDFTIIKTIGKGAFGKVGPLFL